MSDEGLAALHKEAQTHTGHAYIRPKDASTLLILDRSGSALRVLMGKRHQRHTFMPGKFVFPAGGWTRAIPVWLSLPAIIRKWSASLPCCQRAAS
ncbi:hypothetical protein V6L77_22615 [Pannonibacter sp. Pt2-lr]